MPPTRATILSAMQEFRDVGGTAFIAKYANGHPPQVYNLRYEGAEYPMKALWGAASVPAMKTPDFSYKDALDAFPQLGFADIVRIRGDAVEPPIVGVVPTLFNVDAAISEYLELGDAAFLKKHARGSKPKSHYIEIDGERYPLKALWRATIVLAGGSPKTHTDKARAGFRQLGLTSFVLDDVSAVEAETERLFLEGERYVREVELIRRNKAVVALVKGQRYPRCAACDFDFGAFYGELGEDYIECHHVNPLSGGEGVGDITKPEDLVLLCSNCHRMVHRKTPCLTVAELREWIKWAPLEPMSDFVIEDNCVA